MRITAAVVCVVLGGAIVGCSAVLGLTSGSPLDDDAGADATAETTGGGCAAGQKSCAGVCVSVDDPAHGCGAATCGACVGPNAKAFACQGGACVVTACGNGVGDCDHAAANGCETDTTNGAHCGSCTQACVDPSPICSGATCIDAGACDGSVCGTSCDDTKTAIHHCGNCTTDCTNPQPPNTSADCKGGKCVYACSAGALDCNGDLGVGGGNGCECTTGCAGTACCPAGGCPPPDAGFDSGFDAGQDSGPPDTGAPDTGAGDGGCTTGGCLGPGLACTIGTSACCCPMNCEPGVILPFAFSPATQVVPDFPDTGIGGHCCVPNGAGGPGACPVPDPCCAGSLCRQGGSGWSCGL